MEDLGIYLSVPFCPTKCSYCNFASDVGAAPARAAYAALLRREIALTWAAWQCPRPRVGSIYWGGGTPTLLTPADIAAVVAALREGCDIAPGCEHTAEAAPGTLTGATIAALCDAGVNRVSLGVQSLVDAEARAVGRRHDRATVAADIARLRAAGIANISIDLIAGLPHQTASSWRTSLESAVASGVPHLSIYMLEIDDSSRLGRELLARGGRYHASSVPDDDAMADFYEFACEFLSAHGLRQYEISNFARPGRVSRHNLRYWLRQPYLGFGLDAHSHLPGPPPVRFANFPRLADYAAALHAGRLPRITSTPLTPVDELEETLFLGLRRNAGLSPPALERAFGGAAAAWWRPRIDLLVASGLLGRARGRVHLTPRGRLLSNEVFGAFLGAPAATATT